MTRKRVLKWFVTERRSIIHLFMGEFYTHIPKRTHNGECQLSVLESVRYFLYLWFWTGQSSETFGWKFGRCRIRSVDCGTEIVFSERGTKLKEGWGLLVLSFLGDFRMFLLRRLSRNAAKPPEALKGLRRSHPIRTWWNFLEYQRDMLRLDISITCLFVDWLNNNDIMTNTNQYEHMSLCPLSILIR